MQDRYRELTLEIASMIENFRWDTNTPDTNIPESPKATSLLDSLIERAWEPFVDEENIQPTLTKEEAIANFFLGFFPDIEDPEDLALELSTFLEDLQVHARAKNNQQIVDFCDFFADNADQLAIDLLNAKKSLRKAVEVAVENEFLRAEQIAKAYEEAEEKDFLRAEQIAKAYEEAEEKDPVQQIGDAQDRLGSGQGIFRKTEER